jgi:Domain of unknown function (DUF5666)
MNRPTSSISFTLTSLWKPMASMLTAAVLAAGCGGGGGVDTGGTGTTTAFSSGRISGFGSIIVNGIRFDDSTARVFDDDGVERGRGDLKLGMVTGVNAGAVTVDTSTGLSNSKATEIRYGSEIKGPVQALNAAAGTLTVIGQSVKVDTATVFEDLPTGLAGVQVGNLLEVYGFLDRSTGSYTATRIERKLSLLSYKVVGPISALDANAKTFSIGGISIGYGLFNVSALPTLSNGLDIRATLQTIPKGNVWTATALSSNTPVVADGAQTELEGFITDFVSTSNFKVAGVAVNASGSGLVFKNGTAAQLANGVAVEVEGVTRGGVLAASQIEVKSKGGGGQEFQLFGAIESVNAATQSFVLRGTTVSYSASTRIDNGSAANLLVGASVEVRGVLSGSGNQFVATRLKF